MVVLKGCGGCLERSHLTVCMFGGYRGLERTDFKQFLLWEGVVVLKDLIVYSFYIGRVC